MKKLIFILSIVTISLAACKGKPNSSTSESNKTQTDNKQPEVISKNALIGYWVIPEGEDKLKYPVLSIDPMGTMTSYNMEKSFDHWSLIEPNNLSLTGPNGPAIFEVISVDMEKLILKDEAGKTITYEMDIPPADRM